MEQLTFVQFIVALLMGLGAIFIFIWGMFAGMFHNVEAIKHRAYRLEVDDDE